MFYPEVTNLLQFYSRNGVVFVPMPEQFAKNTNKAVMFVKYWLCYIVIIKCLVFDKQGFRKEK